MDVEDVLKYLKQQGLSASVESLEAELAARAAAADPEPDTTPDAALTAEEPPAAEGQLLSAMLPSAPHREWTLQRAHQDDFLAARSSDADHEPAVVFFQPKERITTDGNRAQRIGHFSLPVVYDPTSNALEESVNFPIAMDTLIAGQYRISDYLGSGAFSRAVQCMELGSRRQVCIKIVRNNKDFVDQALGEIRLLRYLNEHDPDDSHHILRLLDFFYFREHLFIVTELLRDNLYELYKYIAKSGWPAYFTLPRLRSIGRQLLTALSYIHSLELIHCDLKPENILIVSLSRCVVKLIDFGSSSFVNDPHSSYIQSRAYRSPEVVLGVPYGQKIDVWSLGAILCELSLGAPLFCNRSVQALLAGHQSLGGEMPTRYMEQGRHVARFYHRGRLWVALKDGGHAYVEPTPLPLASRLGEEAAADAELLDFLAVALTLDDERRATASELLAHPAIDPSLHAPPPRYQPTAADKGEVPSPFPMRKTGGEAAFSADDTGVRTLPEQLARPSRGTGGTKEARSGSDADCCAVQAISIPGS